jgi:hypothetical protein
MTSNKIPINRIDTLPEKLDSKADSSLSGSSLEFSGSKLSLKNKDGEEISSASIEIPSSIEVDGTTIDYTDDGKLQSIGSLAKSGLIKYDWIGTTEEYNAGVESGLITSFTVCYVTDDEEETFGSSAQTDLMIQKHSDLTSGTISFNKNVSIYRSTVSSATTFIFNTTALGLNSSTDTATFELKLKMSSVATITFPSSVKWQNGEVPDLSKIGIYYFAFRTDDGGSTWYGNCKGRWEL